METPAELAADAGALRQCPTRVEGPPPLIAHLITPGMCHGRQGALYHKCASCEHGLSARSAPQRAAAQLGAHAVLQPAPRISLPRLAPAAPHPDPAPASALAQRSA